MHVYSGFVKCKKVKQSCYLTVGLERERVLIFKSLNHFITTWASIIPPPTSLCKNTIIILYIEPLGGDHTTRELEGGGGGVAP